MQDYVERRDGGYYLAGTRIGLDSIVHALKDGATPEDILLSFPLIGSLEQVRGAIDFCEANKELVEEYLREQENLWREFEAKQTPLSHRLAEKLRRAKESAPRRA